MDSYNRGAAGPPNRGARSPPPPPHLPRAGVGWGGKSIMFDRST